MMSKIAIYDHAANTKAEFKYIDDTREYILRMYGDVGEFIIRDLHNIPNKLSNVEKWKAEKPLLRKIAINYDDLDDIIGIATITVNIIEKRADIRFFAGDYEFIKMIADKLSIYRIELWLYEHNKLLHNHNNLIRERFGYIDTQNNVWRNLSSIAIRGLYRVNTKHFLTLSDENHLVVAEMVDDFHSNSGIEKHCRYECSYELDRYIEDITLVAKHDDIIGYYRRDTMFNFVSIYIHPDYRHKGLSRVIYRFILEDIRNDRDKFVVHTTNVGNKASIKLAESLYKHHRFGIFKIK